MAVKRTWHAFVKSYHRLVYPEQGVVLTVGTYDPISHQARDVELVVERQQLERWLESAKEIRS